ASPTGQYPNLNANSLASALAVDPATGDILAVGDAGLGRGQAAMVELNSSGTLNTAFGNGGWLLDNTGQSWSSVIVQPPTGGGASVNEFVVAGTATLPGGGYGQLLLRLTANGSLDQTFGNGGSVVTTVPNANLWGNVVTQAPDGSLIVGGAYQVWY